MEKDIILKNLFDEFWVWRLKEYPEFATQIGIHDYDYQLDSYKLEDFEKRKEICEVFITRAGDLLPQVHTDPQRFNLQIFIEELTTFVEGLKFGGIYCPINYMEGLQVDFERLIDWMVFENAQDFDKLLARLEGLPQQIDEIITLMKEGVKQGFTNHSASMGGVLEQFDAVQIPPKESPFFAPFIKHGSKLDNDQRGILEKKALDAIESLVLPAFKKLRDFIADEYLHHLREDIACSSLPSGIEMYQQCLKFHLTEDRTPAEVHKLGLEEVQRIESEIQEIAQELGHNEPVHEFWEIMRSKPEFYCASKDELLDNFRDIVTNKIRPLIPKVIKNIPKMALRMEPYPSGVPNAPAAFYIAGSHDGSRPGCFYMNLEQFATQPKYEMISLSLHEAEPGHHTQSSYAIEQGDVPTFRRFLEDRKYYECPSRFPFYTAYVEGWALYCESLGKELGLYDDLHARFGHCSEEIFRACRLVVDTGMHSFGWSRQQAVDYMKEHSAASEKNIINEVNRYITWPGQACGYKVGEITIQQFRKRAESRLGPKFDIRDFHEVILSYGGPMSLLESRVNDYITKTKQVL